MAVLVKMGGVLIRREGTHRDTRGEHCVTGVQPQAGEPQGLLTTTRSWQRPGRVLPTGRSQTAHGP